MESCPSWSKEHDWKSCKPLKRLRGFESLALRQKMKGSTKGATFYFFDRIKRKGFEQGGSEAEEKASGKPFRRRGNERSEAIAR